MAIGKVNLDHGYFLEIDALNHALKQEFQGKNKHGDDKVSVRTCGYYGDMQSALVAYVNLCFVDHISDSTMNMQEYINQLKAVHDKENKKIEEIARGLMDDGK